MPPRRVLSLPSPLHCRRPKASPWPWSCPTRLADEPLFQAVVPCLAITPSLPYHLEHALALPPSRSPYRRTARHRPVSPCNPAMSRSGHIGAPRVRRGHVMTLTKPRAREHMPLRPEGQAFSPLCRRPCSVPPPPDLIWPSSALPRTSVARTPPASPYGHFAEHLARPHTSTPRGTPRA
jgi:hypothetical protein